MEGSYVGIGRTFWEGHLGVTRPAHSGIGRNLTMLGFLMPRALCRLWVVKALRRWFTDGGFAPRSAAKSVFMDELYELGEWVTRPVVLLPSEFPKRGGKMEHLP